MDFSTIKLFPDNLIKAIGNTLVHSLWQGLLLAAVTGLIIICTRKSSPAKRYNLLIAALIFFACAVTVTFIIELNQAPTVQNHSFKTYDYSRVNISLAKPGTQAIQKTSLPDNVIALFNKNANIIVLIWFLIVFARSLQLLTGLNGLYHLRRKNISRIDEGWENRVTQLAVKLGIRQIVSIAESGIAKVPMIIGHLKPLILIPVGLMTALSTEEIESILVHELAHIRRRDYLVNMLQSLMEIVFFFNPAVLWISALIKTERENCCDDIAIAQTSSKINYIKALVSCQEYQSQTPVYAMALKGEKGHLVTRVKRMLSEKNQSLNLVEKSLLAVCLVTAGLMTAAFSNAEKINKLVVTTTKAVVHAGNAIKKEISGKATPIKPDKAPLTAASKKDTSTNNKFKIFQPDEIGDHSSFSIQNFQYTSCLYKEKGVLYQLNYRKGTLISMQVNGKTIAQSQIATYQPIIDQIPHKNETEHAQANDKAERTGPVEKSEPRDSVYYSGSKNSSAALSRVDSISGTSKSLQILDAKREKLNEKRISAISDSVNQAYKYSAYKYKQSANGLYIKPKQPLYIRKQPIDYKPYVILKDDERRAKIIDDMLKEGIIQTRDNLSFKISTNEFIVNGKKQPDDIYQKYRAKYVKATGHGEWSWLYNYDTDQKRETNSITDNQK